MKKVGYLMLFAALVLGLAVAGCFLAAIWIDGPKSTEENFIFTAVVLAFSAIILTMVGSGLIISARER